jgi:hypothetical protein
VRGWGVLYAVNEERTLLCSVISTITRHLREGSSGQIPGAEKQRRKAECIGLPVSFTLNWHLSTQPSPTQRYQTPALLRIMCLLIVLLYRWAGP